MSDYYYHHHQFPHQPDFQQPQPPYVGPESYEHPQTDQFAYQPDPPPPFGQPPFIPAVNRPPTDYLQWQPPYQTCHQHTHLDREHSGYYQPPYERPNASRYTAPQTGWPPPPHRRNPNPYGCPPAPQTQTRRPTCWDPPWARQTTAYQQPSSYEPDMYSPPPPRRRPTCWDPPAYWETPGQHPFHEEPAYDQPLPPGPNPSWDQPYTAPDTAAPPHTLHGGYSGRQSASQQPRSATTAANPIDAKIDRLLEACNRMESRLDATDRRIDSLLPPELPEPAPPYGSQDFGHAQPSCCSPAAAAVRQPPQLRASSSWFDIQQQHILNSAPTYTASAISPAATTQSRSCHEQPAAVLQPLLRQMSLCRSAIAPMPAAAAVPPTPQPRPPSCGRPLSVMDKKNNWEDVLSDVVVPNGGDVANIGHLSTALDADARLIPPRYDTPYPQLHASSSWFDMSMVKVFMQPHYLHNFVQSTFNALGADKMKDATLVVSGDGSYYSKDAIQIIIKMAAANGVRRIWVGQNGLLFIHAVYAVIRERVGADGSKANGTLILTASHNPGGPNKDFGIKHNMENGGKYVYVHLRFEEDMIAFSCCVYDGGEQEKLHMNAVRERGWEWKFTKQGRIIIPEAIRLNGSYPLTPLEVGLMLRGRGFGKSSYVYLASGKILDSKKGMAPLLETFPLLQTKETLLSAEELAPFQKYSSSMAALDYTVCLNGEVFVPTQGGNSVQVRLGHNTMDTKQRSCPFDPGGDTSRSFFGRRSSLLLRFPP